ncbi:MAG: hypothetical protein IJU84_00140 [Clostridia bacterium]|nr:hypothetical protein [Clostridia bacterium]MBQ9480558.1 hypothetical protein [Clostridia bacterium]
MSTETNELNAENAFGAETFTGEEEKDSIEKSILQAPMERTDNPFIRAEESEAYKKLEREYREYRTQKVLSRIDALFTGVEPLSDAREEMRKTVEESKGKAVVLPCLIPEAKRSLPPAVRIETLVDYPYASGGQKAVLTEIKAALQAKVEVAAAVNLASYASGNAKPAEKRLKVLKRLSSKKPITPMFLAGALGPEQAARLAATVKANGFRRVKLMIGAAGISRSADTVKIFHRALGNTCPVDVVGKVSTSADAETLFNAGADRIITTDYRTLSRQRLDGVNI